MNNYITPKKDTLLPQQANSTSLASIETVAEANHATAYLARSLQKLIEDRNYVYQPEETEETIGASMQYTTSTKTPVVHLQKSGNGIAAIYPNPANTGLTVEYKLAKGSGPVKIELLDVTGHVVQVNNVPALPLEGTIHLNIASVAAGVYFCRASADGKVLSMAKVVIAR